MATTDRKDKTIPEVPHLENITGVEKLPVSAPGGLPRYIEVNQIVEKALEENDGLKSIGVIKNGSVSARISPEYPDITLRDGLKVNMTNGAVISIDEEVVATKQYLDKNYPTQTEVTKQITEAVTEGKVDLTGYATKDDLKEFATKDQLKTYATKEDLETFEENIVPIDHAMIDALFNTEETDKN